MEIKKIKLLKKILSLTLVLFLCIESFAAVVSDNDGSAFITKAEFEALKSDFDSQINNYGSSLDSKIDGAIAAYLAGIRLSVSGTFTPDIKNLDNVKWRDKLIKIGTARKWTTATAYSDTANYIWTATYDTILKLGMPAIPDSTSDSNNVSLIWVVNNPYGHGGWILSMKADFNGRGYWKKWRWAGLSGSYSYNTPVYPMIRYSKDPFASTVEQQQKIVGWYDYGANFSNAVSSENDASTPPDGSTYLRAPTNGGYPEALFAYKYAVDKGAGRSTNCWGIAAGGSASSAQTSNVGWRPTKASTVIFCPNNPPGNTNRDCTSCNGYETLPLNVYFPLVSVEENKGNVTDDNLHTLMLGSDNDQEVNYYIERTDSFFWYNRPEWPEDCYKDFTLNNIVLRKVGINNQPNESSGGSWTGDRKEDTMTVTGSPYTGAFGFLGVPTSLTCSLPTKPHKKLKLLDSNYVDYNGTRFLTFGEGIKITDHCPDNANVSLEFNVTTNPEFQSRNLKATIELCDKSFNDTTGATYYDVDEGATRLSPGSNKWVLDLTKKNKISFYVRKGKSVYVRFSPNDNSGINYVSIKGLKAEYITE